MRAAAGERALRILPRGPRQRRVPRGEQVARAAKRGSSCPLRNAPLTLDEKRAPPTRRRSFPVERPIDRQRPARGRPSTTTSRALPTSRRRVRATRAARADPAAHRMLGPSLRSCCWTSLFTEAASDARWCSRSTLARLAAASADTLSAASSSATPLDSRTAASSAIRLRSILFAIFSRAGGKVSAAGAAPGADVRASESSSAMKTSLAREPCARGGDGRTRGEERGRQTGRA